MTALRLNRDSDCYIVIAENSIVSVITLMLVGLMLPDNSVGKLNQKEDMSYKIATEVEKGYVRLIVSGDQTLENNKELVFRVLEACAENNVRRALVNIRGILGQPGIVSDYELANMAAQEALGLVQKVALLYRQESHEYTSFFETATRNRGINLLAFLDEDKAIQWLLDG